MVNVSFQRFLIESDATALHEAEQNQQVKTVCNISVNEIFQALSKKASDEAKKASGNYKIINTACEGEGDKTKFLGAGTHLIVALNTSSDNMDAEKTSNKIDKGEALNAIKTYVSWFSGPDVAAKITENDLQPYRMAMSKEEVQQKNAEEMAQMKKEESIEPSTVESRLSKLLFEAGEEDEKQKAADANDNVVGYAIIYSIDLGGQKKSSAEDAWDRLIKNLKSDPLTVKFSNNLFGGNEWEKSVSVNDIEDFSKIDASTAASKVSSQITKDYPGIKRPDVEVLDNASLSRYLSKFGKISSAERELMNTSKYSICIKIHKNEQGYELFKKQDVADVVSKALTTNGGLHLNADARGVIYVNNYDDAYKNKADRNFKKDNEKNKTKSDNGIAIQ